MYSITKADDNKSFLHPLLNEIRIIYNNKKIYICAVDIARNLGIKNYYRSSHDYMARIDKLLSKEEKEYNTEDYYKFIKVPVKTYHNIIRYFDFIYLTNAGATIILLRSKQKGALDYIDKFKEISDMILEYMKDVSDLNERYFVVKFDSEEIVLQKQYNIPVY